MRRGWALAAVVILVGLTAAPAGAQTGRPTASSVMGREETGDDAQARALAQRFSPVVELATRPYVER